MNNYRLFAFVVCLDLTYFSLERSLCNPNDNQNAAERQLSDAVKAPGHHMAILQLIESPNAADAHIRQAAAVHFKNIIKKGWDEEVSCHSVGDWLDVIDTG